VSDTDALNRLLSGFKRTAWRLEALDRYETTDRVRAYLRGDPAPPPPGAGLAAYVDNIRGMRCQGRSIGRVHAIVGPLTPYLRYEVEWGYAFTAEAGDDVRILHRRTWAETPFGSQPPDFWAFDLDTSDPIVALMHYGDGGEWLGLDLVTRDLDDYRHLRELAVRAAVPLRDYLALLRVTTLDPTPHVSTLEAMAT
jgi:Family of unknown function (DUF6879)